MVSDEFYNKAKLFIVYHLIDVDSVAPGISREFYFSWDGFLLAQRVNSHFAIMRFPINTCELNHISFDLNLLVGDHVTTANVKELNNPLFLLPLRHVICKSDVVALWVHVHLQIFRAFKVCGADFLSRWNLHETNSWFKHVFLCSLLLRQLGVEASVNKQITVWCPLPFIDSINSNRLLGAVVSLQKLHGR